MRTFTPLRGVLCYGWFQLWIKPFSTSADLHWTDVLQCYKATVKRPEYSGVSFQWRRDAKLEEVSEPTETSTKWMTYSVADYVSDVRDLVGGRSEFFHDFHRMSSLSNILKLLLHGDKKIVDWASSEPVLVALFNLSGAMRVEANDSNVFSLLDHLGTWSVTFSASGHNGQ